MGAITTSLVINFDAGDSDAILTAEVDGFTNGLNNGNTQFVPGDTPGFLIYKSSNVVIDSITPSAGTISNLGSGFTPAGELQDDLIFTDKQTAPPSKPIFGGFSSVWLGNNLGAPTYTETLVKVPNAGVGVLRINYLSFYTKHRLTNVPTVLSGETEYSVVIYIVGHTI